MLSTRMSVAPRADNSSIAGAIVFFSTMALTATHPSASSAVTVGAIRPGVTLAAAARLMRATLYWQRTYCFAAAVYG